MLMIHIYDNAVDMLTKVFLGISLDITWTLFISHYFINIRLDIPTYKMSTIYDQRWVLKFLKKKKKAMVATRSKRNKDSMEKECTSEGTNMYFIALTYYGML